MHLHVQHRGEADKGLKPSKVDSQKALKRECASVEFICCVLGHRSFIIIELLKYRSLLHIVHDYVFQVSITQLNFLKIHVTVDSC